VSRCASKWNDGDGTVPLGGHAQQREGDRVVAADREQPRAVGGQFARRRLDVAHRLADVEGVDGDVASVGDLLRLERRDVLDRVVGAEQAGGLSHVRGAEARAGPVADAAVERHPDDLDVRARHLVDAGQQRERRDPRETRRSARVLRADGHRHSLSRVSVAAVIPGAAGVIGAR
jgi:hypothetical protein